MHPLAVSLTAARRAALAAAVGMLLLTTGCPSDDDEPDAAPGSRGDAPAETLDEAAAPQRVVVRKVWGTWPGATNSRRSSQLVRRAGPAVTTWMNRAYVDVDYPAHGAKSFAGAFATFTPGAGKDARRQAGLTTGADVGAVLVDVVPTLRSVRLTAYAPHGRAVGATASVDLVLLGLRDGGQRVEVAVTGDLYLTVSGGSRWQVFGYDLNRSVGSPGAYTRAQRRDRQRQHEQQENGQHQQGQHQQGQHQQGQHQQGGDR